MPRERERGLALGVLGSGPRLAIPLLILGSRMSVWGRQLAVYEEPGESSPSAGPVKTLSRGPCVRARGQRTQIYRRRKSVQSLPQVAVCIHLCLELCP